jgi:hypothetical protein
LKRDSSLQKQRIDAHKIKFQRLKKRRSGVFLSFIEQFELEFLKEKRVSLRHGKQPAAKVKFHQVWVVAVAAFLLTPQSQASLIGFWNFDETSGTTANDSSGSGINGTLSSTGAAFDPGAGLGGGGAVSLSSGGYVDMGNNYAFSGTQSFTVQAWIDTTSSQGMVASRTYTQNQDGYFAGVDVVDPSCVVTSSYTNKASVAVGNGNKGCSLFGPPSLTVVDDGQWHQILVTSGGGTLSLYVDGALQGSVAGVNIQSCPTVDFLVGGFDAGVSGTGGSSVCGVGTPSGFFNGLITDVAVWNDTLNSSQIESLFQNPNNASVAESPEPAAFGLLVAGLSGLFLLRHRI